MRTVRNLHNNKRVFILMGAEEHWMFDNIRSSSTDTHAYACLAVHVCRKQVTISMDFFRWVDSCSVSIDAVAQLLLETSGKRTIFDLRIYLISMASRSEVYRYHRFGTGLQPVSKT